MKKIFKKKLELNKKTISNLQSDEMKNVKGATYYETVCNCKTDESCSYFVNCCGPVEENALLGPNPNRIPADIG